MIKIVSVSEMQAIEQEANTNGLSYGMMMANAGSGLAEVIQSKYLDCAQRSVLGLVGSGNNGGDTLVALTLLANHNWKTSAAIIRERASDDPLISKLKEAGGQVFETPDQSAFEQLSELINQHHLVLDGILGTGIRLPLHHDLASVMNFIRESISESIAPPVVIAVDCPSGIDCDSGEIAEECIPADLTVTMAAVKRGLLKLPAYKLVGDLEVVGIGLPSEGAGNKSWQAVQTFMPDHDWVKQTLPPRPLDAHKGTFGTALIIAGSRNYTGAAYLAGKAAYRIGTGLVTLAVPEIIQPALACQLPEATWLVLPHEDGVIAADGSTIICEQMRLVDSLLVGCGFGLAETSRQFIKNLLKAKQLPPVVFDADGLKLMAAISNWHQMLPANSILTPHPGEMAILTGMSVDDIQHSRLETARKFSAVWGQIVVLKGAFTIIADTSGQAAIIPVASPSLASAGTGDVLAGLIAGLLAQGVEPFNAAVVGAWIHASAGLKAASNLGSTTCVIASDVLDGCVDVMADLQ